MKKKNFQQFLKDEKGFLGGITAFITTAWTKIPAPVHLVIMLSIMFAASALLDGIVTDGIEITFPKSHAFGIMLTTEDINVTRLPSITEFIQVYDPNYRFALCMEIIETNEEPECFDLRFPYFCPNDSYGCTFNEQTGEYENHVGFFKGMAMIIVMIILLGYGINRQFPSVT